MPTKSPYLFTTGAGILKTMKTNRIRDLADLRLSTGLSQGELSDRTGIARGTISRIESGRIRPSLDEVRWIAEALEVGEAEVIEALEQIGSKIWTPRGLRSPF